MCKLFVPVSKSTSVQVAGTDHHEAYVLEGENKYPFNSKLITDKASAISRLVHKTFRKCQ